MKFRTRIFILLIVFISVHTTVFSQRFLSDFDSLLFIKDTVRPFIKRFENLRFTGYFQPQFQVAQSKGAPTFEGGNFSPTSQSRFMLRRARIKLEYFLGSKQKYPKLLFAFQVDATERGVNVRDMFMKLYETKRNNFSLTAGLFARPFGFEVNLSSQFRETPERGRMSQILMPSERDVGAMISFEPQDRRNKLWHLKLDAGFFNGQGLSGTTDFDSHKDFISRLTVKPYSIGKIDLGGGLSFLRGGWIQQSKFVYESATATNGDKIFAVDSSLSNIGKSAPRHYYGADVQVKLDHAWGESELRAEYWFGTQPGTEVSTTNPGSIPTSNGQPAPTYIRHFDGAFLLFLQHIINTRHQLMVKYDWYDPNVHVKESEIGKAGTNLTVADIRFNTLGVGYAFGINSHTRLIFYYVMVNNKATQLANYTKDLEDNVFTCRLHFRF
jgi:hypothetical protein